MTKKDITDRLYDIMRTVESCPDGGLSEIDRDILLSGLRDLYSGIKHSQAASQVPTSTDIPETAAMSAYETDEAVVETIAAGFTDDVAESRESIEVIDEVPGQEDPEDTVIDTFADNEPKPIGYGNDDTEDAETVKCVPDEGVRTTEPRRENAHRKAILSLYDEDAPAPSMAENPVVEAPAPESYGFFSVLDEGQQAIVVEELFGGDVRECREAMEMLSRFDDLNDALVYIHDNYKWNPDSRGARIVADLLVDRLS